MVADIGGTNARFAWAAAPTAALEHVRVLPVAEHAGPEQAARAYLTQLQDELGARYQPPGRAAFALATTVLGDEVKLTNASWSCSRAEVQQALGLEALVFLNDFEALALALPALRPDQLRQWPGVAAPPVKSGVLAVIGPGTGLGVAGMVGAHQGWWPLPSEGGHVTLSAADEFESALLAYVRRQHLHVSAERLLSGLGLPLLHEAVAAVRGVAAEPCGPEELFERGLRGASDLSKETLEVFCALLGGFAGNVALTLGARGGLYIGGGMVPRLGERFFASRFRERFEAKGRFQEYLKSIPTPVITDTMAALGGAAMALERRGD